MRQEVCHKLTYLSYLFFIKILAGKMLLYIILKRLHHIEATKAQRVRTSPRIQSWEASFEPSSLRHQSP